MMELLVMEHMVQQGMLPQQHTMQRQGSRSLQYNKDRVVMLRFFC
jgi:hypothetical protein